MTKMQIEIQVVFQEQKVIGVGFKASFERQPGSVRLALASVFGRPGVGQDVDRFSTPVRPGEFLESLPPELGSLRTGNHHCPYCRGATRSRFGREETPERTHPPVPNLPQLVHVFTAFLLKPEPRHPWVL